MLTRRNNLNILFQAASSTSIMGFYLPGHIGQRPFFEKRVPHAREKISETQKAKK